MSCLPIPFVVLVAADCGGAKVNLRFTFAAIPSLRRLLREVNEAFTAVYATQRIHRIFDISAVVVFNDHRCTWDRLEHSNQLYHAAQVYVFQPNLKDHPAELPNPIDTTPYLTPTRSTSKGRSDSRDVPTPAKQETATRVTSRPWVAGKLSVQYGSGARVTSKPKQLPVERKAYKEYVPGSKRFAVMDGARSPSENANGSTPKRFAIPSSSSSPEANSPAPLYPWPRYQPPRHPETEDGEREMAVTTTTPSAAALSLETNASSPLARRGSVVRSRLLSPQRDDNDGGGGGDGVNTTGKSSGAATPTAYGSPRSLAAKWARYRDHHRRQPRPDTPVRLVSPPRDNHAVHVTEPLYPSRSPLSSSLSRGRISVLSVSREGRMERPRRGPSLSPTPPGRTSSLREERDKMHERMHMPLDELRRSLQLEREEMERSLGRQQ